MDALNRIKDLEEKLRQLETQNQSSGSVSNIQANNNELIFQNLFLNMKNACVIYAAVDKGKDFLISDINTSVERMEGVTKNELVGGLVSVILNEMGPAFLQALQRVYQTGKAENFRHQFKDSKQNDQWRDNYILKLGPDQVASVYENVTPLLTKEFELNDSEVRYKALADATSEAVFILENGKCIDFNQQALKVYGYNPEEVIGMHILELVAPQSKQLVSNKFAREYAEPYEGWCIRKNGEVFPAELRGKNFDYVGRRVRISTVRDISAQKIAETNLAKSEAKFRAYFEKSSAINLQIDEETTKIIDANNAAVKFYGYTKKELLSKSIYDLNTSSQEEINENIKRAAEKKQSSFSLSHCLKSGEIRSVQSFSYPIEVDGKVVLFSSIHDITEIKKVEKELKQSEARFRAYFENNTAAMLQIDPQSKQIIGANSAAIRFYGYSWAQFKEHTIYDINTLPPEVIDKEMKVVMGLPAQKFIFNHRLASGDTREVEVYVSPILTDTERQLFITIYDVSEREATKRALEENERKLIEAQRISKIGNWEYEFETESTYWSDENYNIFEIDKKIELDHEKYNQLIHPDDLEYLVNVFNRSVKLNEPFHSIHRIITSKGEFKYVEEKGYTIYDENGRPKRSLGTTQDITEQKLIESELQKSKNYLQEAQRIAKVGHYEYDFRSQVADWSEELSRIFGLDKENLKPDYTIYRSLIHKDDIEEMDRIYNIAKEERRGFSIIYRIVTFQSEQKYLEEKGYFELDKNGKPVKVIGTIQDITSNYLAKKALEESKKELAKINLDLEKRVRESIEKSREKDHILIQQSRHAVLGEMIGNIAHQWRQPLNEISILINDLEDAFSFGMLNKAYFDKTIDTVYRRLKYMSDTINDFSKMHTDDFKKEEFSPKQLIEKLIHFTAGSIKKDNIQIQLLTQDDFLCYGLPNMLSHIVLNLLNNSRDILSERKTKKPKIWIKLESTEDNYSIRVLDNGGGIEPEVIHKIFDPYFTTKDKKRGSGLGLYMVKSMVEKQLQGHIEVVNRTNGAEFKITLKLKINESNG